MRTIITILVVVLAVAVIGFALSVKIVKQYEQGVLFRFGRLRRSMNPGFRLIIPWVDVLHRVSLRVVTMPIQSQGIITRDNVSVDVSAVAYFKVVDAVKSVIAIENVRAAINQIAQTTLRKVVGQHTLDQTLSETDQINADIRKILDVTTVDWGVEVTLVELKDIQLPESMKRAMAKQAEAEREKRAKIINAEGESLAATALGDASDIMMAHPLALQLRNLQSLVEIGVDKNSTVVFPAPLMTTIAELGAFLAREAAAATPDTERDDRHGHAGHPGDRGHPGRRDQRRPGREVTSQRGRLAVALTTARRPCCCRLPSGGRHEAGSYSQPRCRRIAATSCSSGTPEPWQTQPDGQHGRSPLPAARPTRGQLTGARLRGQSISRRDMRPRYAVVSRRLNGILRTAARICRRPGRPGAAMASPGRVPGPWQNSQPPRAGQASLVSTGPAESGTVTGR